MKRGRDGDEAAALTGAPIEHVCEKHSTWQTVRMEYTGTPTRSDMTNECIHGVPTQQCAACRTCTHGLTASRCTRCRAALAKKPAPSAQPSERHEQYEIFFVPAENSWYYRAPDDGGTVSRESYRSAFQARRAVNAAIATPAEASVTTGATKARKKRKS
jgi:hypothetical protein